MANRKPKRKSKSQPKHTRASRRPTKAKPKAKPEAARAPRGQVGLQTYDQVRKVVDARKLPVGKAFAEVAAATGRKPGTVAVTYYRIARQKGGPTRKKRGGKAAGRGAAPRRRLGSVLSRVSAAIKELEEVIARQAQEISRLKGESKLAERIRKALRE